LIGAILFFGGLAWIAVWDYSNRSGPDWLKSEAHPPFPSQEMVWLGFALLFIVAVRVSIRLMLSIFSEKTGGQ